MQRIELSAKSRCASESPRKLRREGLLPAVMYGQGEDSIVLCFQEKDFKKALTAGGANAIFEIVIDGNESGSTHVAMLKDLQRNPMTGAFIHADFYRISMDETITTRIPIHVVGEPVGVKEGGLLQYQIRDVEVECLPGAIPENFTIDIAELSIGDNMTISDLQAAEGVQILNDPADVILSVVAPRLVEEEEEEEEDAEMTEPELIGEEEEE